MDASKDFITAVRAGYPFFYCQTYEINRSLQILDEEINIFNEELEKLGKDIKITYSIWDFEIGEQNPELVLNMLEESESFHIVFAKNWNWWFQDQYGTPNREFETFLQNRIEIYTNPNTRKILVILSDDSFENAIPKSLQKDFISLEFELPNKEEIKSILNKSLDDIKNSPNFKKPSNKEINNIIDSSKGLTKRELINAYAFASVKDKGEIKSSTIADIQAKDIEKTSGLKIGKYKVGDLIGYDRMKKFVLSTFDSKYSKGIMILGPPGTGKTHFAKFISKTTGRKCLEMEMAELFGGLVGESEKLMKEAIKIITANAPCLLFIDEIEKGLAGVGNNQSGDGGTTKRSMGQFLKFLSDNRPEGVYVIATCNDISSLPPEWLRAERWDCAPFFVDLPEEKTQKEILSYYKKDFEVKGNIKDMKGWSGAEIKSCCRIANMMKTTIDKANEFIIPVSKTMENEISGLRKWAKNRTINASEFEAVKTNGNGRAII